MAKKPFDKEVYKGYTIILETLDWDDEYKVVSQSGNVRKFPDRYSAIAWVNGQIEMSAASNNPNPIG